MERKHVSEEEKKKNFIITILLGVLVAIFVLIVIIMIPKGKKEENNEQQSVFQKPEKINQNTNTVDDEKEKRDRNKVTIIVEEGTVSSDAAVIKITDTNKNKYVWTPLYKLQKNVDGKWENMQLVSADGMLSDEPYNNTTGVLEQSLVWTNKYGSLEEGVYRIVKESDGEEFYAEFEIN